jgi:tRNA A-37 threonylcarbamoyl transferase component Bud32
MLGTVVLGNYEITDVLGQGGMSVVYKGQHRITGQQVALKLLPPELAAYAGVKERFLEEARALAQLDHPSIVHLYNFGDDNGCFVLAMQYVAGRTLEKMIIEAGRLDWRTVLPLALDVLKALEFAHSRGIIHRDMKPSNVLVRDSDGAATVMDFGIAKMTNSSRLTATGQTMGTVRYMSPEQVRGHAVDARSDLYSTGMMLYEALAGETPFDGETHFEIMSKQLQELPRSLRAAGVELPEALDRAILWSLAKRVEDRPQSAAALRAVLEEIQAGQEVRIPVPSPAGTLAAVRVSGRRPALWVALAVLVVVASAGVIVVAGRDQPGTARAAVGPAPASAAQPSAERTFLLPDLQFAVDREFPDLGLRVLSVRERDVQATREAHVAASRKFHAFLRRRGVSELPAPPPLTLVVVPQRVFCDRRLYENDAVPADCARKDAWLRVRESTLYLAERPSSLDGALAWHVALHMCLRSKIPGCEEHLAEFEGGPH